MRYNACRTLTLCAPAMLYFVYPRLRKLSGAERLILELAKHTTQLGVPVTLLTHSLDANCASALAPSVAVAQTGSRLEFFHNHYLNAPFEYLLTPRLLARLPQNADAVTFFGPPALPALAWLSARQKTIPKVYFCYEPPRFIYDDTAEVTARMGRGGMLARPVFAGYKWLDRAMVRRADALLANSHFGATRLRAAYGRDATVITHGTSFPLPVRADIERLRAKYANSDTFLWLTVNFLHPRKRIDMFLDAFARFHARAPNSAALIVGAGPESDALRARAQALEIEHAVHFTGFVPDTQLPAYYGASDVYVHTCKNESFGLSVLEASAAGLAVVAVNEGGPREIIGDGETGLLVAPTPDEIANAVLTLSNAPAKRAQMGAEGKKRAAAMYSWERGAREFLGVVRGLGPGMVGAQVRPQS